MEPVQQAPQPTNPMPPQAPMGTKSGMGKTWLIVIILVILALLAFLFFRGPNYKGTIGNDSLADKNSTELSQLEQENNAEDFSAIDSDFGADVNAAVK